ncbi:MAG: acyltransferase [Verrucomicrobiales bacterium]|nr:acyltransferase [Verrucomicrobiales bacterium]
MTAPTEPAAPARPTGGGRIMALDAIRQVAAFIVLVQHFFVIFEVKAQPWMRNGLFDAKAAVTLFFVLSGYVLALSIRREPISLRGYVNFGIRRVLRLYPMHFAATLLALVVLVWARDLGGYSRPLSMPVEFLQSAGSEVRQWLLQLTLVVPGMRSDFANPPVWTLMTEAKVAIVFPFLAWAILRWHPAAACGLVAVLVLGSDWADRHLVGTVALLGQFALGALLARLPREALSSFGQGKWALWLAVSLGLYAVVSLRYTTANVWIAYYLGSFGAAGLIIATLRWDWLNARLTALQRFFRADISYGLYILHFPLMLWLRKLTGEQAVTLLSGTLLFLASFVLTVILSVILMYVAERPAIALGKKLTSSGR